MSVLEQSGAGLALAMGIAVLLMRQVTATAVMLTVQCGAVAIAAVAPWRPEMAISPLVCGLGCWLMRRRPVGQGPAGRDSPGPAPGTMTRTAAGVVLAILCQSLGILALPTAILLLGVLLAAARRDRPVQLMALVAAQNGIVLVAILTGARPLFALACLALPLPLAVHLVPWRRIAVRLPWAWNAVRSAHWLRWTGIGAAVAILAATLIVPLDPLASAFAPVLALEGVLRSVNRRNRRAGSTITDPVRSACAFLAVSLPDPAVAWMAVLATIAAASRPGLSRRWDGAVLAFLTAGIGLYGILLLPAAPPVLGWFSLFAGFAGIASVVPGLAPVLAIVVLRLAISTPLPPAAMAVGTGIAAVGLLACAAVALRHPRIALLELSNVAIAVIAICTGQASGRFAALVLLVLLILTRSAARFTGGLAPALAKAGLAGTPPCGVFPGLLLAIPAIGAHEPWLLLPIGAGLAPGLLAALPRDPLGFAPRRAIPSLAWLPLALTVLVGYLAPEALVHWWRAITGGGS